MNLKTRKTLTLITLAGMTLSVTNGQAQITRPPSAVVVKAPIALSAGQILDHSANLTQLTSIDVQMIAASSGSQPVSVTLKWVVDNKWVAPLGYNIFRKGPTDADFLKIGTVQQNLTTTARAQTLGGKAVDVGALMRQAAVKPSRQQSLFKSAPAPPTSSRPAFDELKTYYQRVFSPFTGKTRPNFDPPSPDQFANAKSYYAHFQSTPTQFKPKVAGISPTGPAADMAKISAATQPKTAEQQTLEARQALTFGSLVNNEVSTALGLRYVDANVQAGQTYEYKLQVNVPANLTPDIKAQIIEATGINPDNPGFLGGVTITVGADPMPLTPTGLAAFQRDARQVCLRWERDRSKSSARTISYNLYRTRGGQKTKLNAQPLIIGAVKDSKGAVVDPVTYYTDTNVPVGPVKYEVTGLDAFGRETQPAGMDFAMADWTTPDEVQVVKCQQNSGQVNVFWLPSKDITKKTVLSTAAPRGLESALNQAKNIDPNVQYFIWRFDVDGSKVWTRLNDAPIAVRPVVAPSEAQLQQITNIGKARDAIWDAVKQTYADTTAQKDNYYLYCVTAVYAKNNLESAPSNSEQIGVADLTPPAAPANLTSSFVSLVKQPTELIIDTRTTRAATLATTLTAKTANLSADPAVIKSAATVMGAGSSIGAVANTVQKATPTNSDLGGKVVVSWQPIAAKAPVRYRIYRANATGFLLATMTQTMAPTQERDTPGGGVGLSAVSAGALAPASSGVKAPASMKSVLLKYSNKIEAGTIKDSDFALVAETTDPKFEDIIPKSRPMYYAYRVTAVSRWGVEGQSLKANTHVLATLKPPTPQIIAAIPGVDGGVYVSWQPLDDSQYVQKYLIYRKTIQIDPAAMIQQTMPGLPPDQAQTVATALKTGGLRVESLPQNAAITSASLATLYQQFQTAFAAQSIKNDYQVVGEAAVAGSTLNPSGMMGYNDNKGLIPNSVYSYVIVAQDIDNWKSDSSSPIKATPFKCNAKTVTNLQATVDSTGNGVTLTWAAGETEIRGYVVKRSVGDGSTYVQISPTLTATTYTDSGAMRGKEQTWQVFTIDQAGNLSKPGEVKFTPTKPKELMRPDLGGIARPGGVLNK